MTASRDKSIGLWNYLSGTLIFKFNGHDSWVRDLAIISNSNFFVSVGEDKTIRIWDIERKKNVYVEKNAHDHFITSVDYNVDFGVLTTGSVDKFIKVWKIGNADIKEISANQE